jgi:hypothetical protein
MFAATYIYAKGYEGGSGVEEGLRFGAVVGVFVVGYTAIVNYAIQNIGPNVDPAACPQPRAGARHTAKPGDEQERGESPLRDEDGGAVGGMAGRLA